MSEVVQRKTAYHLDPADVRVDTFRASGNGGQHRNKTDSAVRMVHVPTGVMVTATEDRSQTVNRKVAWQRLESKLSEATRQQDHDLENLSRKSSQGTSRAFSWTQWRDEVKGPHGKSSMSQALSGKLGRIVV